MALLLRAFEHAAATLSLVAGVAVASLAALITIDIGGRDVFGASIQGTDEIGGDVLALVGSLGLGLGLGLTVLRRGHPRIETFFRFVPRVLRDVLHVLARLAMAGFALFMAGHARGEPQTTRRSGAIASTPLQTPLWVPQAVWPAGMIFFAQTACLTTAQALLLLASDRASIGGLHGAPTVEAEVRTYIDPEGDDARN